MRARLRSKSFVQHGRLAKLSVFSEHDRSDLHSMIAKEKWDVSNLLTRLFLCFAVFGGVSFPSQGVAGPVENAIRSAESYLSMTGFSRDGLIEQLSSPYGDSYSISDATAAVDSLSVDWNAQAVRSAEQYLQMTGFSCSGLIEQLSSEYGSKYTVDQATYGAKQAGAC